MMERLRQILDAHRDDILERPNVIGVGIGHKSQAGQKTDTLSIIAFVERKVPAGQLALTELVPPSLDGVPTDVVEVGRIRPLLKAQPVADPRSRIRPIQPGCSIGHYLVSAGTLGAVVYDNTTGGPLLLSNNHVLANGSSGRDGRCRPGDPVLQPGAADGGEYPRDAVARLDRFVGIHPAGNHVDAAVATPSSSIVIDDDIISAGPVRGVIDAVPGQCVIKYGRTTELTTGMVRAVHVDTNPISYGSFEASFMDQIFLTAMSAPGDSGSLVLSTSGEAIGLLFAGSESITIANPLGAVLDQLEVHLRF